MAVCFLFKIYFWFLCILLYIKKPALVTASVRRHYKQNVSLDNIDKEHSGPDSGTDPGFLERGFIYSHMYTVWGFVS